MHNLGCNEEVLSQVIDELKVKDWWRQIKMLASTDDPYLFVFCRGASSCRKFRAITPRCVSPRNHGKEGSAFSQAGCTHVSCLLIPPTHTQNVLLEVIAVVLALVCGDPLPYCGLAIPFAV